MKPPPCVEIGRPLNPCARAMQMERVEGRVDLPQEHWFKWKIRGQYLVGPGGMRFTSATLAAAWRHYVQSIERGSPSRGLSSSLPESTPASPTSDGAG